MATIRFKGTPIHTRGDLPTTGRPAPQFHLLRQDLSAVTLETYKGKTKLLNIFPSIDTPVCATSVKKFREVASSLKNTVVLNISADLPFAQKRFCGAERVDGVEVLSTFRSTFAKDWNVEIVDSALACLCARAVVVLDRNDHVIYTELVPDIGQEPNYDAAVAALRTAG